MMKRITAFFLLIILLIAFQGLEAKKSKKSGNKSWKTLKALKVIPNIKLFKDKIKKVKARYERAYILDMTPIRQALENSGVSETVTIEVRYRNKLVERLGTYEPEIKEGESGPSVSFESIAKGFRMFTNLANVSMDIGDAQTQDPNSTYAPGHLLQLWFKNAKGKVKARLKASFVFINSNY